MPILTPENVYTMPPQFWQNFEGKLWIGAAGKDASRPATRFRCICATPAVRFPVSQPIALNKGNFAQFIHDNAALIANPAHSMVVEDNQGNTLFSISDVSPERQQLQPARRSRTAIS